MITDSELLELEILLIEKYKAHIFDKLFINETTNEIIAFKKDLELLLLIYYPDRYRIFKSRIILSESLFNLIQMRYFSTNLTVIIEKLKSPYSNQK